MQRHITKLIKTSLAITLSFVIVFTTGFVVNATELTPVEKTENENGDVFVQTTNENTEYKTVVDKVDEITPNVQSEPVLTANSVEDIKTNEPEVTNPESLFASCRLIITSPTEMEFKEESLGVDNIKSVTRYDGKYIVEYRSCHDTEKAYNFYTGLGYEVEIDEVTDAPEGVDNKDVRDNEVRKEEIANTDEVKPTQPIEQVNQRAEENTIVVAVLDTGLNDGEAIFNNKVVQGKNFIDENDTEVKDLDTHGTTMARIILGEVEDVNVENNIKVMPIKVLNDEGKGTTLTAYKGIKYVIEKKQQNPSLDFIINLSMSGIGHSKLLELAINEAYNNNIPVVVSAGNDNKEITEYTPANIDSAFTITSTDKKVIDEENIEYTKAVYSNFGSDTNKVDYTTNGHYEYTHNIDNREVITKVDGTSVSSAYVTSFVVMLKQMALSDEDTENDNLSIADIDASLSESAISVDASLVPLGKGYLEKENIHLKKVEEEEQEALPIEEISSEDLYEGIELYKDESIVTTWDSWQSFHDAYQFYGVPAHFFDVDANLMIDDSGWHFDYYCPFGIAVYLANNGNDALWIKGGCPMAGGQVNGQKFCAFEYGSNPVNPIGFCHGDGSWQTALTVNGGAKLSLNGGAISKPNGVGRNLENYGTVEIENHSMDNSTFNHKPDCIIYNSGTLTFKNGALRASVDRGSFSEYGIKNYGTVKLDGVNVYSRSDTGILNSGRCQISNGSDIHGNVAIHHNSTSSEMNIENSRVLGSTIGIENVSPQRIFIDNSNIQGSAYGIYQHGNSSSLCDIRGDSTYIHTDSKNLLESAIRADAGIIVLEGGQLYNSAIGIWNTGAQVYSSGGYIHDNNIGWACYGGRNEVVQKFNTNYGYRYSDVYNAFGNNWIIWYSHWLSNGLNEGRYGGTGNSTLITANSDGVKIGGWNTFVNRNCNNNDTNYNGIYDNPTCIHITDNAHTTLSNINAHNENTAWSNGVLVQKNSTASIDNCILSHNWVDLHNADSDCTVTTSSSTFSEGITGMANHGTITINSGTIKDNSGFGLDNEGKIIQSGGTIQNNKGSTPEGAKGGVLQKGTYKISSDVVIDNSNSVYLADTYKVVNVTGDLNIHKAEDPIKLTTAVNDRQVGRTLVIADNVGLSDRNESKFAMAFAQPQLDGAVVGGGAFSGKTNSAKVRAGSRVTGVSNNVMILSGLYKVVYDGNASVGQYAQTPQFSEFYYMEPVLETLDRQMDRAIVYNTTSNPWTNLEETGEKVFIGWSLYQDGSGQLFTTRQTESLGKDKTFYAVYRREAAKVRYNPNGAYDQNNKKYNTKESDKLVKLTDVYSDLNAQDLEYQNGSVFSMLGEGKLVEEDTIYTNKDNNTPELYASQYIVNKGASINNLGEKGKLSSFQGWSTINYVKKYNSYNNAGESIIYNLLNNKFTQFMSAYYDATSVLNNKFQTKGTRTMSGIVNTIIAERNNNISKWDIDSFIKNNGRNISSGWNKELENNGIVDLYAIWDEYPVFNKVDDVSILSSDLSKGQDWIEKRIMRDVVVTDKEYETIGHTSYGELPHNTGDNKGKVGIEVVDLDMDAIVTGGRFFCQHLVDKRTVPLSPQR